MTKKPTFSALTVGQTATRPTGTEGRKVAPRNISYRDYFDRWGYLPPGFTCELDDGTEIIGGCAKWRAHADALGYPKEPPPGSTSQEKIAWQRFLDKTYRPWMNGDDPIKGDLYYGDWDGLGRGYRS